MEILHDNEYVDLITRLEEALRGEEGVLIGKSGGSRWGVNYRIFEKFGLIRHVGLVKSSNSSETYIVLNEDPSATVRVRVARTSEVYVGRPIQDPTEDLAMPPWSVDIGTPGVPNYNSLTADSKN